MDQDRANAERVAFVQKKYRATHLVLHLYKLSRSFCASWRVRMDQVRANARRVEVVQKDSVQVCPVTRFYDS